MSDDHLLLKNQVCFPIYSTSRLLTKAYKPHLEKLGITYPQYLVLLVLWENDSLSVNSISEKLYLNSNTLSPLLQRMERNELIHRIRSTKDERSVCIKLSQKGKKLKSKALQIPEKLFDEIVSDTIELEALQLMKDTLCNLIDALHNNNK